MTDADLAGRLLVATPALNDPNFARTVVLLLEHGPEGAVGVVLNRPSDTAVVEVLPDWAGLAVPPETVFVGGPVQPTAAICLGTPGPPSWRPLAGRLTGLATVDLDAEPPAPGAGRLRVWAGYAGWDAAQLAGEIEEGAWYVLDAGLGDPFTEDPARLWPRVLRRQGGRLAMVATYPPDPTLN